MSITHWVIILVILLIVVGPGKLPEVGKSLGKAISEFKNSVAGNKNDTENRPTDETSPKA